MSFEQRLVELGIVLPPAPEPPGNYSAAYVHEGLAETAGHLPFRDGLIVNPGRVGDTLASQEGAEAAAVATLNALASLRAAVGSLNRVQRIVKVRGYVVATRDFASHHVVTNGASDLIGQIFGTGAGAHVRASVGVYSLPFGAAVEIELTALLHPEGTAT